MGIVLNSIIAFRLKEKIGGCIHYINNTFYTYSHYFLGNVGPGTVPTLLHLGNF